MSLSNENIVEKLKQSVEVLIKSYGSSTEHRFTQGLLQQIESLRNKLNALSPLERDEFTKELKNSFHSTIEKNRSETCATCPIRKSLQLLHIDGACFYRIARYWFVIVQKKLIQLIQ